MSVLHLIDTCVLTHVVIGILMRSTGITPGLKPFYEQSCMTLRLKPYDELDDTIAKPCRNWRMVELHLVAMSV